MIFRQQRVADCILLLAVLCVLSPVVGLAQSGVQPGEVYRIGADDVLRLSVPQDPALDSEGAVQANGTIYVTQIGEVVLAGLTIAEAEEVLLRRLRLYNPGITEVVLGVVEYNAFLDDGTCFDTTTYRGRPIEFDIDAERLIPGILEALLTMQVGGRRKVIIPPYLAYGERGYGDAIPPNATLIYDLVLVAVTDE